MYEGKKQAKWTVRDRWTLQGAMACDCNRSVGVKRKGFQECEQRRFTLARCVNKERRKETRDGRLDESLHCKRALTGNYDNFSVSRILEFPRGQWIVFLSPALL